MAIKEFWYRQDLDKPVQVRQMSGVLFTEDNEGDLIGVEVSKGGHPYELTGSVIGYIIKEDGVTESVNGTLSNSRAYITLPSTALDVPGIIHIAIRVTNGSEKAVVCAVRGLVNRSRSEIVNTSGRTIYGIDDLLAQISAMEQATTNANTATTNANNAASNANEKAGLANTAASNANEKAGLANTAANTANTAANKINSMTVEASGLASGATPTAQVSDVDGHKHIAFGIPKGDTGETGATPNLTIGTVSTLAPDQSASATITGTAENPVLNLSLPRGQTGSITNAYGSNIPYSESDSRTIKQVVDALPSSIPTMTGATASTAGTAGIVPAPEANKHNALLHGDGSWSQEVYGLIPIGHISMGRKSGTQIGSRSVALGGYDVTASGTSSHAEGDYTIASGESSHAEGNGTTAIGQHSHAEGLNTTASGPCSHAEGYRSIASGERSHAEGTYTIASCVNQHAFGKYNIIDNQSAYVEIVGNGNSAFSRSNARTLDWDGNEVLAGDLTINSASNPVAVSSIVMTPSTAFAIPGAGASVSYDMAGITANHRLITWGFSSSPENNPPTTLSWSTANGYFTITNNGVASSETIQPVFVLPTAVAITAHVEEGEST